MNIAGPPKTVDSVLCLSGFPVLSYVPNLRWCGIRLIDGPGNDPDRFLKALEFLDEELEARRKVLVHCMEGKSRSVLTVALYIAATDGRTLEDAIDLVASRRPVAAVDPSLVASLPAAWPQAAAATLRRLR
ncbi:MAG: dual specificity protein phosphatase family protein [Dehalococcoidia bacterium]|nr:dual specificity protein phosphatase family protein [Dehalococcoidia bacterium]